MSLFLCACCKPPEVVSEKNPHCPIPNAGLMRVRQDFPVEDVGGRRKATAEGVLMLEAAGCRFYFSDEVGEECWHDKTGKAMLGFKTVVC